MRKQYVVLFCLLAAFTLQGCGKKSDSASSQMTSPGMIENARYADDGAGGGGFMLDTIPAKNMSYQIAMTSPQLLQVALINYVGDAPTQADPRISAFTTDLKTTSVSVKSLDGNVKRLFLEECVSNIGWFGGADPSTYEVKVRVYNKDNGQYGPWMPMTNDPSLIRYPRCLSTF